MDQLRQEKRVYLDFQKTESDIERLSRTLIAFEYTRHQVSTIPYTYMVLLTHVFYRTS